MGQKVHPTGFRLGIATDWTSKWYADRRQFAEFLEEDLKIREFLKTRLAQAGVSRIQISRPAKSIAVTIHTARPGIIIGKKGEDIERLRIEVAQQVAV
ncbi:MAG: 30S ribosomal protein S3, partial [Gammaproteobacteria bacterium]|nr:30S ribosomal protein S3 [Gammaproteobacteria bacterium]